MKNRGLWFYIVVAVLMVLNFQNCGGALVPLDGVVEQQSIADIDHATLPQLLADKDYVYRSTNGVVSLNKSTVLAETSSVIMVIDRTLTGAFYRFYASDHVDEVRVSIEPEGVLRVWHISTINHLTFAEVPLPEASYGNQITVAAAFNVGPESITFLVNGVKQSLSFHKGGSPYDNSYLQRTLVLSPSGGQILDVAVFARVLTSLELNVMSRSMANALQIYNVSFDASLINDTGDGSTSGPSEEFLAAKTVIDNNCLSCHSSSNYGDFRNLTEAQYISKGLVVAKNPGASKIYYRLNGALAGSGPRDMPEGGAALSTEDVAKIETWINSID